MGKGILTERKDLVDGTRVYRVALKYLARFKQDYSGYYFDVPPHKYRLTVADPTAGNEEIGKPPVGILRDWVVWGT
jgi:hypothetical protein